MNFIWVTFCFRWKCEWFAKLIQSISFMFVVQLTTSSIWILQSENVFIMAELLSSIPLTAESPIYVISYCYKNATTHTSKKREQMRDITIAKPISGHVHIKQWHYSSMSCPTYLFLTISHTHTPQCALSAANRDCALTIVPPF